MLLARLIWAVDYHVVGALFLVSWHAYPHIPGFSKCLAIRLFSKKNLFCKKPTHEFTVEHFIGSFRLRPLMAYCTSYGLHTCRGKGPARVYKYNSFDANLFILANYCWINTDEGKMLKSCLNILRFGLSPLMFLWQYSSHDLHNGWYFQTCHMLTHTDNVGLNTVPAAHGRMKQPSK